MGDVVYPSQWKRSAHDAFRAAMTEVKAAEAAVAKVGVYLAIACPRCYSREAIVGVGEAQGHLFCCECGMIYPYVERRQIK